MFVPAICPNCGGTLKIDDKLEAAVCKYCSTPFIVEKAINNYITNHNTYIQQATIVNKESAEDMLERGITQIKIGRYRDAAETFTKMGKEYPGNWKAWYGLSLANGYFGNNMNLIIDNSIRTIFPYEVLTDISSSNAPVEEMRVKVLENSIERIQKNLDINRAKKREVDVRFEKVSTLLNEANKYIREYNIKGSIALVLDFLCVVVLTIICCTIFRESAYLNSFLGIVLLTGFLIVPTIIAIYFFDRKIKDFNIKKKECLAEKPDLERNQQMLCQYVKQDEEQLEPLQNEYNTLNIAYQNKLTRKNVQSMDEYYMKIFYQYG